MHRHEDSKNRPSGETVAFNDAAMIPDDLGNQSKTEASPARFGRNEGIKQVPHQIGGHTWPIVLNAEFERQGDPGL